MIETNVRQALNLLEEEPFEWMPGWLLTQYHLPLLADALPEIHFPHSMEMLEQARRRLAFDELLQLQIECECCENERKPLPRFLCSRFPCSLLWCVAVFHDTRAAKSSF